MKTKAILLITLTAIALMSFSFYMQSRVEESCCGTCTGSASCNVCSDCSQCGYCNSGGSCGVCMGGTPSQNYNYIPSTSKPRITETQIVKTKLDLSYLLNKVSSDLYEDSDKSFDKVVWGVTPNGLSAEMSSVDGLPNDERVLSCTLVNIIFEMLFGTYYLDYRSFSVSEVSEIKVYTSEYIHTIPIEEIKKCETD